MTEQVAEKEGSEPYWEWDSQHGRQEEVGLLTESEIPGTGEMLSLEPNELEKGEQTQQRKIQKITQTIGKCNLRADKVKSGQVEQTKEPEIKTR